ncbi:MAG: CPBP family intramembrane glutamic endopeptidase [Gammaproteobacteria bacterium]
MRRTAALLAVYLVLTAPFLVNGVVYAHLAHSPVGYWTVELLFWVVVPLAGFGYLTRAVGMHPADIGFTLSVRGRRRPALLLALCAVTCAAEWYGYSVARGYFATVLPDEGLFDYEAALPAGTAARLLVALYFALTAGFVEEAVHRGLGRAALAPPGTGPGVYLAVTPLLFALVHWESGPANVAAAYVIGLAAALAFLWLRTLVPLVAGHVFTDLVWFGW